MFRDWFRHAAGAAALAAAASFALPAMAADIVVPTVQGELTIPQNPEKVLVLDVTSLDILDALGVEVDGVLGSNLPPYLAKYADDKYLKVGTIFEPDYEAINAAEADLIIIGGRSSAAFPQLSGMLPTLDLTLGTGPYFDEVRKNITTLGQVFGKEAEAAKLIETLNGKIDALKAVAADAGTAINLVTNAGALGVYGPASRIGWIHTEIGFKPVIENIDDRFHGGDAVSFEFLLESNPSWMFVVDRDAGVGEAGNAAQQVLDNELVHQTTAWKEGNIVYLDPQSAYIVLGGYTSLTTLIDQIYAAVSAK
jgi:iron complex transport system substrate-binding protein